MGAWDKEEFEMKMVEVGYVNPDGPFIYNDGYIGETDKDTIPVYC